jgi:hypothetical protein
VFRIAGAQFGLGSEGLIDFFISDVVGVVGGQRSELAITGLEGPDGLAGEADCQRVMFAMALEVPRRKPEDVNGDPMGRRATAEIPRVSQHVSAQAPRRSQLRVRPVAPFSSPYGWLNLTGVPLTQCYSYPQDVTCRPLRMDLPAISIAPIPGRRVLRSCFCPVCRTPLP